MQKPKKVSRFKKVFIFHDDFFHNAERNTTYAERVILKKTIIEKSISVYMEIF